MANSKINAFLVHLGFNMWLDQPEKDGIHALPGKGRYLSTRQILCGLTPVCGTTCHGFSRKPDAI